MSGRNQNTQQYLACFTLFIFCLNAKAQTFSPYTPAQINEFNQQPIAPIETPAGPLTYGKQVPKANPQPSWGVHYFSQPLGEEEAESQETDSAVPFEPDAAILQF